MRNRNIRMLCKAPQRMLGALIELTLTHQAVSRRCIARFLTVLMAVTVVGFFPTEYLSAQDGPIDPDDPNQNECSIVECSSNGFACYQDIDFPCSPPTGEGTEDMIPCSQCPGDSTTGNDPDSPVCPVQACLFSKDNPECYGSVAGGCTPTDPNMISCDACPKTCPTNYCPADNSACYDDVNSCTPPGGMIPCSQCPGDSTTGNDPDSPVCQERQCPYDDTKCYQEGNDCTIPVDGRKCTECECSKKLCWDNVACQQPANNCKIPDGVLSCADCKKCPQKNCQSNGEKCHDPIPPDGNKLACEPDVIYAKECSTCPVKCSPAFCSNGSLCFKPGNPVNCAINKVEGEIYCNECPDPDIQVVTTGVSGGDTITGTVEDDTADTATTTDTVTTTGTDTDTTTGTDTDTTTGTDTDTATGTDTDTATTDTATGTDTDTATTDTATGTDTDTATATDTDTATGTDTDTATATDTDTATATDTDTATGTDTDAATGTDTDPVEPNFLVALEGIYDHHNGTYMAYISFLNATGSTIIPEINQIAPQHPSWTPPAAFVSGSFMGTIRIPFNAGEEFVWTLKAPGEEEFTVKFNKDSLQLALVEPLGDCNTGAKATLGYRNSNLFPIYLPVGRINRFSPGSENLGQPNQFFPGTNRAAFSVTSTEELTWHLPGHRLNVASIVESCSCVEVDNTEVTTQVLSLSTDFLALAWRAAKSVEKVSEKLRNKTRARDERFKRLGELAQRVGARAQREFENIQEELRSFPPESTLCPNIVKGCAIVDDEDKIARIRNRYYYIFGMVQRLTVRAKFLNPDRKNKYKKIRLAARNLMNKGVKALSSVQRFRLSCGNEQVAQVLARQGIKAKHVTAKVAK